MAASRNRTAPSTTITTRLGDAFVTAYEATRSKMAGATEHGSPSLAAFVLALRAALGGVSQMQLGTNRGKDNKPLVKGVETPASLAEGVKGRKKSGWFSLIANVEQGGRKTAIPPEFVAYLAAISDASVESIQALVAEDGKVAEVAVEANEETPAS